MKLLLDENFPEGFKKELSKLGHDVLHINKIKKGLKDKEVFDLAIKDKRIIISNDMDFKSYIKYKHYGIIRFNSDIYQFNDLYKLLNKYNYEQIKDNYIEFHKKNIYFYKKIYSKKGKYKQQHRIPIRLD